MSNAPGYYDTSYPPSLWTPPVIPDPNITSLAPNTAAANSGPLTVVVTGVRFLSDSVVEIDHVAQTTTYLSPTSLSVSYSPLSQGTKQFTVRNGGSGGEESNDSPFTVTAPAAEPPEEPDE